MWLLAFIIGTVSLSAQDSYTLRGVVEDSTGEPLTGASVLVKGTTNGVATDIDGNFALKVKNGDVISISYIGYKPQEIPVTGQNDIKVVLVEDTQMLEDVVVIGYGTARKKDLTGAVVQVNPDKIADQNPGSVQDVLRGVPGLQIGYDSSAKGQGASIRLRGQNSLGTDAAPMIVLDGMAFYGELSEINPDDIAQIDVLKDASSAAIYGARAAAGVIIITTKKGKEGKPTITLTANVGVSNKAHYNDFYGADGYVQHLADWNKMMYTYGKGADGLYGYYNVNTDAHPKGYYDDPRKVADQNSWANSGEFVMGNGESAMGLWGRRLQLYNSPIAMQNFIDGITTDWNDLTFRTGVKQDYNASVSGATENVNYYVSAGYMKNEGTVQGTEYEAFRANMKIHTKITPWLEFGANANFQNRSDGDISVNLGSNYWDANMLRNSPYASLRNAEGKYEQYPMSGASTNGGYNYYFDRQYYDLDKGYTTTFNIAPRYQWFHDRYWMAADKPNTSAASQGVNRENVKTFDWNLNNTLTWDRTFLDVHHVTVTLVQEAEDHKYWQDRIEARNIQPTDVLGFHYTEGANKEQSNFRTKDVHYTATSYLGRAFYSYDNKYLITGSFRRDGFSGFGQNNKWGNFGSVGLGWNFSDEKFMESTRSWLDNAKLRVSWGTNGNREFADLKSDPNNVYKVLANLQNDGSMVYYQNGTSTIVNALSMNRLGAPDLRWERTEAWNYGLDFSVFNSRLTGNIDIYSKSTKDMIMNQRLPSFSGFGSIMANLGEVTNKGFEIALNSVNIDIENFQWSSAFAFSYNKSCIKHIYGNKDENGKEPSDTSNKWYIGKPIGEIWDYKADGVWQNTPEDIAEAAKYGQVPGDPKILNLYTEDDVDGTPIYNDNDKVYLGTTIPPIYWSLRNDFTLWKNFTFSFSLYSYMGHKSLDGRWMNDDNGGSQMINGFNLPDKEYWTPDNPTNDFCRLQAQGPEKLRGGVGKLINRSFVRLDNITLGYTIPQSLTRQFQVERIRVTASCNNVCTFHSNQWKYGDPETGGLSNRTFNFGLNVIL